MQRYTELYMERGKEEQCEGDVLSTAATLRGLH